MLSRRSDVSFSNATTGAQPGKRHKYRLDFWTVLWSVVLLLTLTITMYLFTFIAGASLINGLALEEKKALSSGTPTTPDYFQTTPQIFPGPTATGRLAPFLAQINPLPFGTEASFVPNAPLETSLPITGDNNGTSIFQMMGHLSTYFSGPGFGSNEYPLPPGANISQVHVLHRHGSRYPTSDSAVSTFGNKIYNITQGGSAHWLGTLSFLNDWKYTLGSEILVARGRQELFDSGVLFYYNYGRLYNTSSKIIARTTSQDRMLKSAEYFMAGFFGLEWTQNATLEVQLEQDNSNTSLAGYLQCPNANNLRSSGGTNASLAWQQMYLTKAVQRLNALSEGYPWTIADAYDAQTLCPYETVAYGYSRWCELFTYEEWQGFEYSVDLTFHGDDGFGSPTGRGVGIGYVQEIYARLQNHLYDLREGATNVNYTLATMSTTFPLNQTLYFDFSHDTNIFSILTALGIRQFAENLPPASMPSNRSLVVSHITPFAARVVWEIIQAPRPVKAARPNSHDATTTEYYDRGDATSYVHMTISQRTVPLYQSFPACGQRDDGWCDLDTFMKQLNLTLAAARYYYSCFGDYTVVPYGDVTDGTPVTKRDFVTGLTFGGTGSTL